MPVKTETPIQRTQKLGVEFWNDSCRLSELTHAVEQGAVGATSNPVLVGAAVEADPGTWLPFVAERVRKDARASEDDLAWRLIEEVARVGARVLAPTHKKTAGKQGWLCVQVHPKLYRNAEGMLEQALRLATIAPNIAIKVPATEPGLEVMEELTAAGIPVNATVSFTVAQAVACAQAMERGLKRARKPGSPASGQRGPAAGPATGYVTLMVGRIDDHLKRLLERDKPSVDVKALDWAGIAVFKAARQAFERHKFHSRLLVAAYRHERHWTELVGPGIVQSIPYGWWTKFNASSTEPKAMLGEPVDPGIVLQLLDAFPDFRAAYEEDGLKPADFVRYGASVHTLDQFITGYHRVLDIVRKEMLSS